MNNTFNLKRFGWYFKKHTMEHGKTYLQSLLVAIGVIFLALAIPAFTNQDGVSENAQFAIYLFVIWLGGSIFTSTIFTELGDRKKAILPLTLPVSHLEKFLVGWLFTFPIFLIIATGAFYAVDGLVLSLSHPIYAPNKMLNLLDKETRGNTAIIVFLVLHIFSFWGAIYFNKLHFIKTGFTFFLTALTVSLVNYLFLLLISNGELSSRAIFFNPVVWVGTKSFTLNLSDNIYRLNWIVLALSIILLWFSAFYKLKEKQV